jgi:hypothetical protein
MTSCGQRPAIRVRSIPSRYAVGIAWLLGEWYSGGLVRSATLGAMSVGARHARPNRKKTVRIDLTRGEAARMQSRRSRHPWALFAFVLGFAFVHDATADTVTAYKHCEVWRPPGAPAPAPKNCSWHGASFIVHPSGQVGAHEISATAIWDHNSTQFDRSMWV